MKSVWAGLAFVVIVSVALAACGDGDSAKPAGTATPAYAPTIDSANFSLPVTNRYFPLTPGTTYVYEGTRDGEPQRDEVTVTSDTRIVAGVLCVVVHDVVTQQGELTEETFDWYAQDAAGNVWYFGEDSKEYEGGKVVSTHGSWEAGVDGAQPGIVMKAAPSAGDTFRQEYYAGEAEDMSRVLKLSESVQVAAGSYRDVLVTEDFTPLEPDVLEHKYFAPGVGLVKASMVKGGAEEMELVQITTE